MFLSFPSPPSLPSPPLMNSQLAVNFLWPPLNTLSTTADSPSKCLVPTPCPLETMPFFSIVCGQVLFLCYQNKGMCSPRFGFMQKNFERLGVS